MSNYIDSTLYGGDLLYGSDSMLDGWNKHMYVDVAGNIKPLPASRRQQRQRNRWMEERGLGFAADTNGNHFLHQTVDKDDPNARLIEKPSIRTQIDSPAPKSFNPFYTFTKDNQMELMYGEDPSKKQVRQFNKLWKNDDWRNARMKEFESDIKPIRDTYINKGLHQIEKNQNFVQPESYDPSKHFKNPAQVESQGFWNQVKAYDEGVKQDNTSADNTPTDIKILGNNAKTNGLDFGNVSAVQQWLTDNGFDTKGVDGMYGANTKKAIDAMLASNDFTLSQSEKDMFRNFQKNSTFYGAKKTPEQKFDAMMSQNSPWYKYDGNSSAPIVGEFKGLGKEWGVALKRGGFIKRHQQGGQMNQDQQELQLALMGYIVATKKQPKDENEINQIAQALVQLKQQDPQQFAQLVQLGQQAQSQKAEKGAKLNYLKSLKGQCPAGEELVYFKKGGMICSECQKKEKGGEVKQPKKANAIEEFKKGRKSKKC